jgi:TolB-like protein
MKHCPECNRNYADSTLSFCLQDGAPLIFGAAEDEPETALLSSGPTSEAATRAFEPAQTERQTGSNRKLIAVALGVFFLVVFGIASYFYLGRVSAPQIESIAVMPFANESGNPDVEYLSDGMTETLIGSLTQLPNLNVKARTSVFRYKGKEIDPRSVANDLHVQAILTGRVLQRANNLTLYVELIDTTTENVLWKAEYQRQMTDLVTLQNEIARDVSQKLRSRLTPADTQKLTKDSSTTNAEAYRLYLEGRYHWNKRVIPEMGKAIGYFQQAIDLDGSYALAYAGLADAIAQPNDLVPHIERRDKALAAIEKALALDPDLAEAHTARAHILFRYDLDFAGAEGELKRSLELDPRWIDTYQRLGEVYTFQGQYDEAAGWFKKGLDLEPFNVPLNTAYAASLYFGRRYDEAISQLQRVVEIDPNHRNAQLVFYSVYTAKGMYAEAVEHHVMEVKLSRSDRWGDRLKDAFAAKGWNGFLRAELQRFSEFHDSRYLQPNYGEAGIYTLLGEKDKAFAALERAVEAHEQPSLAVLKVDPRMDPLRDDPRFKELLTKAGFSE